MELPAILPPNVILLNIYDVVEHPFAYTVTKMLTLGIHHTGIQVGMREFAFTLEGIVITEPHKVPRCQLTHRVVLTRAATEDMLQSALQELSKDFTSRTYDPLLRNCNHFSQAFCEKIAGPSEVPGWVNRAPEMASLLGTRFRLRPPKEQDGRSWTSGKPKKATKKKSPTSPERVLPPSSREEAESPRTPATPRAGNTTNAGEKNQKPHGPARGPAYVDAAPRAWASMIGEIAKPELTPLESQNQDYGSFRGLISAAFTDKRRAEIVDASHAPRTIEAYTSDVDASHAPGVPC